MTTLHIVNVKRVSNASRLRLVYSLPDDDLEYSLLGRQQLTSTRSNSNGLVFLTSVVPFFNVDSLIDDRLDHPIGDFITNPGKA